MPRDVTPALTTALRPPIASERMATAAAVVARIMVPAAGVCQTAWTLAQMGLSTPSRPIENAVRALGSNVVWTVATVEERKARIASEAHGSPTSFFAKAVSVVALFFWISSGVITI